MPYIFVTVLCHSPKLEDVVEAITYWGPKENEVHPAISIVPSFTGMDRYQVNQIFTDPDIMWPIVEDLLMEQSLNVHIHHA